VTSKYDALGDHLAAIGAATIILTFAEVEAVVGLLPQEARLLIGGAWWGATSKSLFKEVKVRLIGHRSGHPQG
jgi:hypothetical protein